MYATLVTLGLVLVAWMVVGVVVAVGVCRMIAWSRDDRT